MSKLLHSSSSDPILKFLKNPLFRDWVLRPDQSLEDYWLDWGSRHPDDEPDMRQARQILLEIGQPHYQLEESEIQTIWTAVQHDVKPKELTVAREPGSGYSRLVGVAACLIAVVGIAVFFLWTANPSTASFQTGNGETLTITLPDSSQVMLNANSSLAYRVEGQASWIREVWVGGEAFFDVKHLDGHEPFMVYPAPGIEVEVLGTQFTVYHRNDQTKVLLSEGNVTMNFIGSKKSTKILMKPGDLVEYHQKKIQKKKVNPATYVSWTKKVLQLDGTTLREMVRMAEENYGLAVNVGAGVDLNQSASGSMPLSDGTSFMRLAGKIFNIRIVLRDSVYYIE